MLIIVLEKELYDKVRLGDPGRNSLRQELFWGRCLRAFVDMGNDFLKFWLPSSWIPPPLYVGNFSSHEAESISGCRSWKFQVLLSLFLGSCTSQIDAPAGQFGSGPVTPRGRSGEEFFLVVGSSFSSAHASHAIPVLRVTLRGPHQTASVAWFWLSFCLCDFCLCLPIF